MSIYSRTNNLPCKRREIIRPATLFQFYYWLTVAAERLNSNSWPHVEVITVYTAFVLSASHSPIVGLLICLILVLLFQMPFSKQRSVRGLIRAVSTGFNGANQDDLDPVDVGPSLVLATMRTDSYMVTRCIKSANDLGQDDIIVL